MGDLKGMRLKCTNVDSKSRIITLIPTKSFSNIEIDRLNEMNIVDDPNAIVLDIPQDLDRLSFTIKCLISHPQCPLQDYCTLIASDTPVDKFRTQTTISTFEMILTCSIERVTRGVRIGIVELKVSYSFYFGRIFGRTCYMDSVHDKVKVEMLITKVGESGLKWNEKYFKFDVVIHYLLVGEDDDILGVIEFLKEFELQHQNVGASSTGSLKTRYYRTEGK